MKSGRSSRHQNHNAPKGVSITRIYSMYWAQIIGHISIEKRYAHQTKTTAYVEPNELSAAKNLKNLNALLLREDQQESESVATPNAIFVNALPCHPPDGVLRERSNP